MKQQVWVIGSRETASASPLARRFSGAINLGGVVGAVTANVYAPAIGLETNLGFLSVGGCVFYAPAIGSETTWVSFPSGGCILLLRRRFSNREGFLFHCRGCTVLCSWAPRAYGRKVWWGVSWGTVCQRRVQRSYFFQSRQEV